MGWPPLQLIERIDGCNLMAYAKKLHIFLAVDVNSFYLHEAIGQSKVEGVVEGHGFVLIGDIRALNRAREEPQRHLALHDMAYHSGEP